jgi:hypothetical protein
MREKDYLYIVVPYFNFLNSNTPKENLITFINNNNFTNNVKLIISEGVYGDSSLNIKSSKIFNHLKFNLKNILWAKENLINLAIKNLPNNWKYVLWCDKDILFKNDNWAENSIEKLKSCDVIQPWIRAYHLEKNQRYIPKKNNLPYVTSILYFQKELINEKGHSGMVWGINKNFYEKINKILDWQIVGQADLTFAFCCGLKDKNKLLNFTQTKFAKDILLKYAENFNNIRFDYIENEIYHLYHGNIKNRNYVERLNILLKHNYNPNEDTYYDENGVLSLTDKGRRMENDIKEYFYARNEDDLK